VIGTGHLGATHAICMAARGYEVIGVDVDPAKKEALRSGQILPRAGTAGAPGQQGRGPGPAALHDVVRGGCRVRRGALRLRGHPAEGEFLREAHAVADTIAPDRLVFGVTSLRAEAMLRRASQPVIARGTPIEMMDLAPAELVKVAANSFLATRISFINAMSEICDLVGADVRSLSAALAHAERIGGKFLKPGLGFGGGCLLTDIRAFKACVDELGGSSSVGFRHEVDEINERCRSRVFEMAHDLLGGSLAGKRVAVLGAAFRPDSDDIRDSPALDMASRGSRPGRGRVAEPGDGGTRSRGDRRGELRRRSAGPAGPSPA
jgi:UDPglucose 6-dehydrogenase